KGFLFAIIGLFVMITLVSLLMPSRVVTSNSIVIKSSSQKIALALRDFNDWKKWHPVFVNESSNVVLSNPAAGVNATAAWGTDKEKNKLTIKKISADLIQFSFSRPGENPVENSIVLFPIKDSPDVQVEWTALTTLKWYPWEKFGGIFLAQITGPGYEAALNNLKTFVERQEP
ncbi:MAG: SRPBCC family protein, partial [Gloeobacteraceae cyanobacterium ES-bin-316]|nr:SRPBCC family protein [Ferruginibacter sp.]